MFCRSRVGAQGDGDDSSLNVGSAASGVISVLAVNDSSRLGPVVHESPLSGFPVQLEPEAVCVSVRLSELPTDWRHLNQRECCNRN